MTQLQRAILATWQNTPGFRSPTYPKPTDMYTDEELAADYRRCPAHVLAYVTFETSYGDAFAEVEAVLRGAQREDTKRNLQAYKNQKAEAESIIKKLEEQLARLGPDKQFVGLERPPPTSQPGAGESRLSVGGATKDVDDMPF